MCEVAGRYAADGSKRTDTCNRILKQLARELLLAQSSDWAFLMKTRLRVNTPPNARSITLLASTVCTISLSQNNLDEEFLRDCELRDNIFPNVNWRYYA